MKKYGLLLVALAALSGILFLVSTYLEREPLWISPDLKQGWQKTKLPDNVRAYQQLPESQWNTAAIATAREMIRRINEKETIEVGQALLAPDGKSTLYIFRKQRTMSSSYMFRFANSNNVVLEKGIIPDA